MYVNALNKEDKLTRKKRVIYLDYSVGVVVIW